MNSATERPIPRLGFLRQTAFWLILALVGFSIFLAYSRIYQVDEAQNLYPARILASGWVDRYYTAVELWHIWPLSWFATWTQSSSALLHSARFFMLAVFWANISLIALSCGVRWNSRVFLWILLGAATLAPLWDYGFEVRHENLLLLLLLAFLRCMRMEKPRATLACLLIGALAALMPLIAFKSVVYWPPLLLLFLLFPPAALGISRWRVVTFVALGFVGTGLWIGATLHFLGRLPVVLRGLGFAAGISANPTVRFSSLDTFARLIYPTPLLSAVALSALIGTLVAFRENWKAHLDWTDTLPESVLLLTAIGALVVNPTPFLYNLCLLTPFAFILAVRWITPLATSAALDRNARFLAAAVMFFAHFLPFSKATLRHLDWTNERQHLLIDLAERMTDSGTDRVYDAAGLVSSRESIGHQWFLHSLIMERIYKGQLPSVKQMLTEHPAAVLIPNYRFGWLQKDDLAYIQANYVALAGDFLVLGRTFQGPQAMFACLHPGRYCIRPLKPGPDPKSDLVDVDGVALQLPSVLPLSKGDHSFRSSNPSGVMVSWIGPNLDRMPNLGQGNANSFFYNWY